MIFLTLSCPELGCAGRGLHLEMEGENLVASFFVALRRQFFCDSVVYSQKFHGLFLDCINYPGPLFSIAYRHERTDRSPNPSNHSKPKSLSFGSVTFAPSYLNLMENRAIGQSKLDPR